MFNQQELQNLSVFLQRTNLTGNESTVHAILLNKIMKMLESKSEPNVEEKQVEENEEKQ